MVMLVLMVAIVLVGQEGASASLDYDKVKDVSTIQADLGLVLVENDALLAMAIGYRWDGQKRQAVSPEETVYVVLGSASDYWTFLRSEAMYVLADDFRVRPKPVGRDRMILYRSKGVPVSETILYQMTFGDLIKISQASTVDIAAGPKRWTLSADQMNALRQCVVHLQVDSEASRKILEARDAQMREAAAAQADAVAAHRARMADLKKDFDATIVVKARKAASRFPKNKNDLRQRAVWRVYDDEISEFTSKHAATSKELDQIRADYPEFRSRLRFR